YMNGCCPGRRLSDAGLAAVSLVVAVAVHRVVPTGAVFAGVVAVYCIGRVAVQRRQEA
ncbi:MAG: hypothetical protein JO367_01110, partial [Actinobacteria bacterium]|nr:hypothetical protein [Actinomycetota bacterium]